MSSLKNGNVIREMSKPSELHAIHPPATIKLHTLHSKTFILVFMCIPEKRPLDSFANFVTLT